MLYYFMFFITINLLNYQIKAIEINKEEKNNKIHEEILLKKRNAEIELNIAKQLKNKVDESFEKNLLLTKEIEMIENENDENTAISQLKAAEKQFKEEKNENILENIYVLLNSSLQNYKKSITNIKKYKALVNKEILKKEIIKIQQMIEKTDDFFYDKENAINLKKEIQTEMENIQKEGTAINLSNKAKLILEEAENIYLTSSNNDEIINNKYDRATFYFQESFDKYQNIKIKLKKFFIEIFKEEKTEEKNQNEVKNEITISSHEQNKLKQWQIILLISGISIFLLILILLKIKNKYSKNFFKKIKNNEFMF
ncbi:hypothetical protein CWO85_03530 [Candidatus Phytoplasma ziziphi]|uniref:Uncharacterized protein n=2 Tax=Acholeplasmataceae TaxID=2146 RepID=A0A660HNJ4_ZIZJU|nr:hypothetical protein CWO85_03530 [Candidatus Phytoplasma ziziphi]